MSAKNAKTLKMPPSSSFCKWRKKIAHEFYFSLKKFYSKNESLEYRKKH